MDYERRNTFRAWPQLSEEERELLRLLSILDGRPIKDRDTSNDPTPLEEIQSDYDDIWWHCKSVKSLMDGNGCRCCTGYNPRAASLVKAKSMTFRSNWKDNNAKRKTLRTHRNGSRRHYRLRPRAM